MRARGIVIHCSASRGGDADDITAWHRMRGFGRYDPITGRRYCIGYHAVILNGHRHIGSQYERALDGKIEPGRPDYLQGAHCAAEAMNLKALGVCIIGNPGWPGYFTERQKSALIHYLSVKCWANDIPVSAITQHSDHDWRKPVCASLDLTALRELVTAT